ncbi:hypothetical protein [Aquibacillus albus]|uniref:DUF4365 domain-containing protein n=1 Tax=Aquibacillus albus TaxID=1168171 RepID=A0ABS2N0Q6_9BACI|nr:hypothetical protein [Aquibacillus albus]MBM7571692.1 hypothetical protein [Aquibacillus albus]
MQNKRFVILLDNLNAGWQEAKYVGLYFPKKKFVDHAGVSLFSEIEEVKVSNDGELDLAVEPGNYAVFQIKLWKSLEKTIKPVNYGIKHYMMTTLSNIKEANELPEL